MPRAVPFRGRERWTAVAFDLGTAAVGAVLAAGVLTQVPADVVPLRALALYTVYAVAATVVLAVARALTRQLPTLRRARLGGEDAWVLRAWAGDWWHATALDAGLVVLAGWLAVLGLRAGGDWLVPSVLLASTGVWFLVRVLLGLAGRRIRETLWLTDREVVHGSPWGRARAARARVVDVAARGRGLVIRLDGPAELRPCPRPWRRAGRGTPPDAIRLVCSDTGHDAADLVRWVRSELSGA